MYWLVKGGNKMCRITIKFVLVCSILISLSSCNQITLGNGVGTPTHPFIITVNPTLIPPHAEQTIASSHIPATSPLPATPTIPQVVNLPKDQIKTCNQTIDPGNLPADFRFPGSMIFRESMKFSIFDGGTLQRSEIDEWSSFYEYYFFQLNPDGQSAAFLADPPRPQDGIILTLIQSDGKMNTETLDLSAFPIKNNQHHKWVSYGWINDQGLLFDIGDGKQGYWAFYNPFKRTWGQDPILVRLIDRFPNTGISLSPDQTRAIYVKQIGTSQRLVLLNLVSGNELWSEEYSPAAIYGDYAYLPPITWSPNSSVFLLPVEVKDTPNQQLFIVDRAGKVIHPIRPESQDNGGYGHRWSPDGRFLAFVSYLRNDPEKWGIIIYDLEQDMAYEACALDDSWAATSSLESHHLEWSPDSHYLVFSKGDRATKQNQIILFDLLTGNLYQVNGGQGVTLIGWSKIESWKFNN